MTPPLPGPAAKAAGTTGGRARTAEMVGQFTLDLGVPTRPTRPPPAAGQATAAAVPGAGWFPTGPADTSPADQLTLGLDHPIPSAPGAPGAASAVPAGSVAAGEAAAWVWLVWEDDDVIAVYADSNVAYTDLAVLRSEARRAGAGQIRYDCLPVPVFTTTRHPRPAPTLTAVAPGRGAPPPRRAPRTAG